VALFIAFVLGVLIGMPPYVASAKYKNAIATSNPEIIQKAAYLWPYDSSRMIQVAMALENNKLVAQGLQVAADAVVKCTDNYGAWATLASMTSATAEQKSEALAQMKRLDPMNPTLK
jgi:hypothetical protein